MPSHGQDRSGDRPFLFQGKSGERQQSCTRQWTRNFAARDNLQRHLTRIADCVRRHSVYVGNCLYISLFALFRVVKDPCLYVYVPLDFWLRFVSVTRVARIS